MHLLEICRDLEVYRTLLTKGGRIVFEVAVDYSQTARIWKDMIRLWVCLYSSFADQPDVPLHLLCL